ncbi:hypothetical protein K501DRAFT_243092 [Backusella circina FSU 941]|nr:hypothetical protein K501DRAFT_243092 [Backusella circina FSU 941]
MCDVRDPRILATYYAITEDEPTNWLMLGYNNTKDTISLYSSGTNGLAEFRDQLKNEILYGFVRVEDRFILISYVPDSVSGVRRARALVHSRSVASILELSHAQITASSPSDLSDSNVRTRLKLNDNVVPNRPRPTSVNKRTSYITRKRNSMPYSPSSSPSPYSPSPSPSPYSPSPSPSPMSDRNNLKIYTEPESLLDRSGRSSPITPTSIASIPEEDEKKRPDEATIMALLQKKKDLEAARFKRRSMDEKSSPQPQLPQLNKFQQPQLPQLNKFQQQKEQTQLPQLNKFQQQKEQTQLPQLNKFQQQKEQTQLPQLNKFQQQKEQTQVYKLQDQTRLPRRAQTQPVLNQQDHVQTLSQTPTLKKIDPPQKQQQQPKKEPVIQKTNQQVINETLMTGFASIQSIASPFWKRRYFELQNGKLLWYRDELTKTPILDISLNGVTRLALANEDEDTFVPNSFVLDTQLENYQIYAENKKSAREIFNCLKSLIPVS